MAQLSDIAIDAVQYPCDRWRTLETGDLLTHWWKSGFTGGMGVLQLEEGAENTYYGAHNVDTSQHPYIRMAQAIDATVSVTSTPGNPAYAFYGESSGGDAFVYILNGRYSRKVFLDDNTVDEEKDFGVGAVCGRPALFEGTWRVPLGASFDYQKLTTIAEDGAGGDTWTAESGIKADHFAVLDKDGTAQLARAFSTNVIDLSGDGTTFGDDFEVGDSSLRITDLFNFEGQLLVIKPDGPWEFDQFGVASPIQGFVSASKRSLNPKKSGGDDTYDGSNSFVHGPFAYWISASGNWRIFQDSVFPIGFEADDRWLNLNYDSVSVFGENAAWYSITGWGRYMYGTYGDSGSTGFLVQGILQGDGSIRWLGIVSVGIPAHPGRAVISEGDSNPILWYLIGTQTRRFDLNQDGSMREAVNTNRLSGTGRIWMPFVDFGMPEKQKQARRLWVIAEDLDANNSVQMAVHRDLSSTHAAVGSALTTAGTHEVAFTSGTNDLFYTAMVEPVITCDGAADPRIRALGFQAATPHLYEVTIPLFPDELLNRSVGVLDGLRKLRDLVGGQSVAVREPGHNSTWNGYVVGVEEETVQLDGGHTGYQVKVLIQRFNWSATR